MKNVFTLITICFTVFVFMGCAKVQVKAPDEAIKVDISMRLDIYQHIEKDINDIESIVSGATNTPPGPISFISDFIGSTAYAEGEDLSPEVKKAALRRRDRHSEIISMESKGIIGENSKGLLEGKSGAAPEGMITAENSDRMIIYRAISAQNGITLIETQKLYARRLQSDAPTGTPIEIYDRSTGSYKWSIK